MLPGDARSGKGKAGARAPAGTAVPSPLYARSGIPETWLVDVAENAIEVYRNPGQDGFATITRVTRGGVLTVAAFPGETFPAEEVLG